MLKSFITEIPYKNLTSCLSKNIIHIDIIYYVYIYIYVCVLSFVVIHSNSKIEEVYDKSMEVLEKRQQQKRCQVVQTGGGSEDYGLQ